MCRRRHGGLSRRKETELWKKTRSDHRHGGRHSPGPHRPGDLGRGPGGACGIAPITLYDHSSQKVSLAAEVKDFDPTRVLDKKEARRMDRFTQFAVTAAVEAMAQSGLDLEREDTARMGCPSLAASAASAPSRTPVNPARAAVLTRSPLFFIPMAISNLAAGHIAIRFGLHGMCTAPVAACAGGSNAVGDAFRHIRDGYAEVMVVGGGGLHHSPGHRRLHLHERPDHRL